MMRKFSTKKVVQKQILILRIDDKLLPYFFFFFSFTISKVSEARWLMKFKNEILTKKLIVLPQHREFRTLCIVQKWVTLLLIVCLRSKLVRTSAEWNGWIFAQDYSFVNATKIDGEFIPTPAAYMLIFFQTYRIAIRTMKLVAFGIIRVCLAAM